MNSYIDAASIDNRANSALLAIEAISSDVSVPVAVRLVWIAERMSQEPILTDGAPASFTARRNAAEMKQNRARS